MTAVEVELATKFNDVASIVRLKEHHPTIDTKTVLDMMLHVLRNGDVVPGEQLMLPQSVSGDIVELETEDNIKNRLGGLKKYDKAYELIGQRVPGSQATKYDLNPFGIKVGHFSRCEGRDKHNPSQKCNLVGSISFSLHHNKNKKGGKLTRIYLEWTHEKGNHHYVLLRKYDNEVLTWEDIVKREMKNHAH